MTNPNPFVPKGSLLDNHSRRRSRLKLAVFCVLLVSITSLTAMLIQGCKRTAPDNDNNLNPPPLDTNQLNVLPPAETNFPPMNAVSNPPVAPQPLTPPPVVSNPPPVTPMPLPPAQTQSQLPTVPPPATISGSQYTVVSGDTLSRIAKRHGVSVRALEAANPSVVPTRLQIGQKLVIPSASSSSTTTANPMVAPADGSIYTVKSGDTLIRIARRHGTTVRAIQRANHLVSTKILVGQKLKIPSKADATPAPSAPASAPAAAPTSDTVPTGALPPVPAPATAPGQ